MPDETHPRDLSWGGDSTWREDSDATLESLIRAAGDYVQPTGDLRPRTLETARFRCRQQRRAGGMAIAALLLAVLIPSGNWQHAHRGPFDRLTISVADQSLVGKAGRVFGKADRGQADSNTMIAGLGPDWSLVEIYTQLRRQQAKLLHGVHAAR